MYRIGNGYDVHKLVPNRRLILCGIEIPYELGVLGHSDGDVAVHAIMDALLGALALGDIGQHFPDNDPTLLGINSLILLKKVMEIISSHNYQVENIDCTIVLQKPKIKDYIIKMREKLSETMSLSIDRISVKATTEEKLGFTGDSSGVKSYSVALLKKKQDNEGETNGTFTGK